MKNIETIIGSSTDRWAAFTQVEHRKVSYEVRHPRIEGHSFTLWRWDNVVGMVKIGYFDSLDKALENIKSRAPVKSKKKN